MQTKNNITTHTSPKVVRASLRLVIAGTQEEKRLDEMEKRIRLLRQQSKRQLSKYVKTKTAAAYLDVDSSFLDKKRKEGLFIEGIHYHKPKGTNLVLWNIEALDNWITTKIEDSHENSNIIDKMFK